MVEKNGIAKRINPFASCSKYSVPIWQCPQFLFFIMGIVIIGVIISTYFIANSRLGDPFLVALIVLAAGGILLIINFVITNSFERMAEASRMKSELVSIVSHQLRAPLTNIRFALDLLFSETHIPTDKEREEYHFILKENSTRINDLVDNLLTVSKIESGNFPLDKKLVSLEDIAKKMIGKFGAYTKASNIRVTLEMQGVPSKVFADPLWLEQVVENLLDNSIKYTKGGGEVKIVIKHTSGKVSFSIKDEGVGIPQEEQKYVFEKFFRSKSVLKTGTHGSGLGLHIVKQVVELTGGKVWFMSAEGKGTTFFFILPTIKN